MKHIKLYKTFENINPFEEDWEETDIDYEDYFYLINDKWVICDPKYCAKSERSIDLTISDLSEDGDLIDKIELPDTGFYDVCKYIAYEGTPNKSEVDTKFEKLIDNPTVRILDVTKDIDYSKKTIQQI